MALCGTLQRFQHEPAQMDALADQLYRTQWVVYAKPPFGGPAAVVKYLGRYTHRIALSDSRIVALTDTHVSFAWKDCADHNRSKIMTHAGIFPQKKLRTHAHPAVPSTIFLVDTGNLPMQCP